MSLIATVGMEKSLLDEGVYPAVCTKIIDLGIQYNDTFNKSNQQVKIFWDIPSETVEINGETVNRQVSKEYTMSLNEKSNLRKSLQSWRGKAFTTEECQGFDLHCILGQSCQLQIIHKTSERGTYAAVDSIMALPKGTPQIKAESTSYFDMDDPESYSVFYDLPKFVQEKIALAENFEETGLELSMKGNPAESFYGGTSMPNDFDAPLEDYA